MMGYNLKVIVLAGASAMALLPVASWAQDNSANAAVADVTAAEYVEVAASSDMFEIQSSQLALETTQNADIKTFAQHMVGDHSGTTAKLTAAAQAEGIAIPTAMDTKHEQMLAKLKDTDAADFDAAYVEAQTMAHEEAVALHTGFAQNGDSAALKSVATEAVPIVTEHLKDVQALAQ